MYVMHIVYMCSILDYAISFLTKKISRVTKACSTPMSAFCLHVIDFLNFFSKVCLQFYMRVRETATIKQKDSFQKRI